jgi:hypothetical protein
VLGSSSRESSILMGFRSERGYIQHRWDYSNVISILIAEKMMGEKQDWLCLLPYLRTVAGNTERVLLTIDPTSWHVCG